MVAADGGFDQVVDHLLRRGANPHLRSATTDARWNNQTPLDLAKARVAAGVEGPRRDYRRVIQLLRASPSAV